MPLLSVVMPVYNEVKTIREILNKINSVDIDKEIIVVDDFSTDETRTILQEILKQRDSYGIRVIYHSYNKGKGASVREGIREAKGELIVIQDADLEYDPQEYVKLIPPILEGKADLVLGARFTAGYHGLKMHRWGNRFLTGLINFLFGVHLNDYATCYKVARKETFTGLGLKAMRFDLEAEIVCKSLNKHLRIAEIPIVYYPRKYTEGKKIRWLDGVHAIFGILKYRFFKEA